MLSKKPVKKKSVVKKKATPLKKATTGASRHIIPMIKGEEMKNRFVVSNEKKKLSKVIFSHGREFSKSVFEELLKLKGVEKIRIYNAVNDMNEHTFVITAVNKNAGNIYFDLKISSPSKKRSLAAVVDPIIVDGVCNMGDQCSEPSYKKPV